jgi:hypothetical protein
MIAVALTGIGIAAPGLRDWETARAVLAGAARYAHAPLEPRVPDALPAAERRRAGPVTRLAIAVAQEAAAHAGADGTTLASVFASSDGDGETVHQICTALATDAPEISPTRFHNSVQNAASGYWSIAMQSRAPTTAVNGLDAVFASALLEAAVQRRSRRARCPSPTTCRCPRPARTSPAGRRRWRRARARAGGGGGAPRHARRSKSARATMRASPRRPGEAGARILPCAAAAARGRAQEDVDVVLALDGANALKVTIHAARHAS